MGFRGWLRSNVFAFPVPGRIYSGDRRCESLNASHNPTAVLPKHDTLPHIHPRKRAVFTFMLSDPEIPAARVAHFIRQHTHDVRNGLNGLDLEAALLQDIVTEEEGRESVARLRQQLRAVAAQLRTLAARFHDPQPHLAPLAARELLLIWREQNTSLPASLEIVWEDQVGDELLRVDAGLMAEIFRELLGNAVAFPATGPLTASARSEGGGVIFELREPKSAPVDVTGWGEAPFSSTRRGGYGLGLWTVRRLAAANGAQITREFLPAGMLVTRVRFPNE